MERNPALAKKSSGKSPIGTNPVQRTSQFKKVQNLDYAEQLEESVPEFERFEPSDKIQTSALYNSLCVFSDILSELDNNLNIMNSKVDILTAQVGIYQEPEKMGSGEIKGSGYEKELNLNDLISKLVNLTKYSAYINNDLSKIV